MIFSGEFREYKIGLKIYQITMHQFVKFYLAIFFTLYEFFLFIVSLDYELIRRYYAYYNASTTCTRLQLVHEDKFQQ